MTIPRATILKVARRPGNRSQKIDITLDVSAGVLMTLKGVARISAVPFLSYAASIALSIVDVVQKIRNNKHEFRELAKDSCKIVYEIINARKDVSKFEGVAVGLEENLEQLVNVLRSIEELAQKGASRNVFAAMLRYNADARRIQDYQRRLYQAIHIFGLQSDITLRKTIAQMAANQATIKEQLNSISDAFALPPYTPTQLQSRISDRTTVAQLADNQDAIANQLNSIAARVLALPLSMPPSLPIVPVYLRGAPQDDTSRLANSRTLSQVENITSMDNYGVISAPITEFVDHIRSSVSQLGSGTCQFRCSWSRFTNCDRRALCPFISPFFDIDHDTPIHGFPGIMGLFQIVTSWFLMSMKMQANGLLHGSRTTATLQHG